jgi:hypothetical protein
LNPKGFPGILPGALASHLDCIGVPASNPDDLAGFTRNLAGRGEILPRQDGGRMVVWRDPSGAGMVLNLNHDNRIQCVTPTFAAPSRLQAAARGFEPDEKCRFCDRLILEVFVGGGRAIYPVPVQLEDLGSTRTQVPDQGRLTAALTAFAEGIDVWADDAEYAKSQTGKIKLPPELLVRTQSAQAQVMMAGRVVRCERKVNTVTEREFYAAHLRTLGIGVDVVASKADLPNGLAPGNVVQGIFWLVGRVVEGLRAKARWTWVGKVFGR